MAVEFKDYYRILGVERKADDKTIKSAYRKLARKYHPDVNKGQDASFKEINEAYEVLSAPAWAAPARQRAAAWDSGAAASKISSAVGWAGAPAADAAKTFRQGSRS